MPAKPPTAIVAVVLCLLAGGLTAGDAPAEDLTDFWEANKHPEGDFDNLVDLDSLAVYTGDLYLSNTESNCIRGHGAILDLTDARIRVTGFRTSLVIEGCVVMNGGLFVHPTDPDDPALYYGGAAAGEVRNCVFYGNRTGLGLDVIVHQSTTVMNCIFMSNGDWGMYIHDDHIPTISHCAFYGNGGGNPPGTDYDIALWCGCGYDPVPYDLPAGSQCLFEDPLFVAPSTVAAECDFHLGDASPCRGSGNPAGTHMGVYQDGVNVLAPSTWGRIKSQFRSGG